MFLKDALTFSADGKTLVKCDESYEGKVVVPSSMSELGQSPGGAFARFFSAIVSNKVTTIAEDAFRNCKKITSIVLPESINLIDKNAFWGCSSLSSIRIPDKVQKIDSFAFHSCPKLESIDIPSSVMEIGMFAFSDCPGIRRINVDRDNSNYRSEDGVLYSKDKSILYKVPPCFERFIIPSSVSRIDYDAFSGCSRLTTIEIPANVLDIESGSVFWGYKGFRGFVVDRSNPVYCDIDGALCSKDGKDLIRVPEGFPSFKTPDCIHTIKEGAFWGCEKLTEIEISRSVMKIELVAFSETYGNRRYVVAEDNPCFSEKNGAICSKDGRALLHVPVGLETFTVPDGIVYINAVCNDNESIAFENNDKLTSLTIPSSVKLIGEYTFMGCKNLVELHMKHQTPLEAFDEKSDIDVAKVTLFVPRESEGAYRAHPFYGQFAKIVGE